MKNTLNRLDKIHEKLLIAIRGIDQERFARRPAENEWSIAEVVHHLCLVEGRVYNDLEKAIELAPARVGLLKRLLPMRIVSLRLFRVRAPKAVEPLQPLAKDESLKTYDDTRARLKRFCLEQGPTRLKQTTFRHPFFGDIDGAAAISMVAFHEIRHYKQIREILKKLGQPVK